MIAKQFTTIVLASAATLGALAMSAESASARPGFRAHGGFYHASYGYRWGHRRWSHRRWRHRYGWGIYGAPLLIGASAYAVECYYVRRYGALIKICE